MVRLTQYAAGGGCACKVPANELEQLLGELPGFHDENLLVGLDNGDDAAAVRINGEQAVIATADFFTPIVDDPYDFGRIAAANALSDVYAMGGDPLVALNLLSWPRETIDFAHAAEVMRGGADICREANCHLAGGHSIDDKEPKYGLAVTGIADPSRLLRNDAARPGLPLTLTKPLGVGVLSNQHKATGAAFDHAIQSMVTLNRDASQAALKAGVKAATDVTGFGLLGHAFKMARASQVRFVIDSNSVPYLQGAKSAAANGFIPGGSQRNLAWVRPHVETSLGDDELILLADAQTSGGLLVVGEVPGYPVIGHVEEAGEAPVVVR